MALLPNDKHEKFAGCLARGMSQLEAYRLAGYGNSTSGPSRLARLPKIMARVAELMKIDELRGKQAVSLSLAGQQVAYERAIERLAISKESVAREIAVMGFARMGNYVRIEGNSLVMDWTNVSADHLAAIQEVTIDTYMDGKGKDGREVTRVKFKLHDKRAALMDLARMFGWIVEKSETTLRLEEKLATMTPAELDADAQQLWERAQRVLGRDPSLEEPEEGGIGNEGEITEVVDDDSNSG